jgi:hypothetical protein
VRPAPDGDGSGGIPAGMSPVRVRPVGGAAGCLVMILVSVVASVLLTVLLNLLLR